MKTLHMWVGVFFGLSVVSCDSGSEGSGQITANFKNLSSGTPSNTSLALPFGLAGDFGAASVGAGGLSSYKLYIREIRFCESIEIQGSAYNNPQNCVTIFENAQDDYDSFDVAAAENAGEGKYVDLLSTDDLDSLTTQVTLEPGTYNVGIVDWYRPVKITAEVPLENGDTLYTKTCPTTGDCEVTGLSDAPAQESIADLNNGGTWMRFLEPLVVTGDQDFVVDLAFDLEKKIFGGLDVSNGFIRETSGCTAVGGGYCGIYAPILRLMPVARSADESTVVETYEMGGVSDEWKIRVNIFYRSGDSDRSILAADIFPIPTADTASSIAAGVYVYTVTEENGVTSFKDVDGNNQLTDFVRGESGTATLTCPSGAALAGCTAGDEVELSWSTRTVTTL